MPQVYAIVYDETHVLVFKKNRKGYFFWDKKKEIQEEVDPKDLRGGEKYCFPGGKLKPGQEKEVEGAVREFCEETGIYPDYEKCTVIPIESGDQSKKTVAYGVFFHVSSSSSSSSSPSSESSLTTLYDQIRDQLGMANCPEWMEHSKKGKLMIQDNELASVEMVSWKDLPDKYFDSKDNDTDWFHYFVTQMKKQL